jgi:hypothetical protein
MNNESKSNEYILFFRGNDWTKGLSPEQTQNVMNQWKEWFDRLSAQGKLKAGQPLECAGKVVSGKHGRAVVNDGPFAESKEAVGGYFLLTVETMDEAISIAKACPGLEHGVVIEVRQVADMCPVQKALAEGELAHA